MAGLCATCSEVMPDDCENCRRDIDESAIYGGFFKHIADVEAGKRKCDFHGMCLYTYKQIADDMTSPVLFNFLDKSVAPVGKIVQWSRYKKLT